MNFGGCSMEFAVIAKDVLITSKESFCMEAIMNIYIQKTEKTMK